MIKESLVLLQEGRVEMGGEGTHAGVLVFMGVLLLCKAERERRPSSSGAKVFGGGVMVSLIPANVASLKFCRGC